MKKRVVAGVLVAASLAVGVVGYQSLSTGSVSNASKQTSVSTSVKETDYALVANQEEEKYIVKLVSNKTGQNLKLSDWEICLGYLEDNYDELMEDTAIDTAKVESYMQGYQIVKEEKLAETATPAVNTEAEETGTAVAAVEETGTAPAMEETGVNPGQTGYDVNKVLEYIHEYWEEPNPDFPNYNGMGGDCACFVSQCLYAGGMQMVGSNASNFSNWFCRTSDRNQFSKVSSTWRGAEAFAAYWKKNALEYKEFGPECFEDRLAFREVFKYGNPGDAISYINSNGRPYHTVIISYKNRDNDRELRFAGHTSPQWEKSVYDYCKNSTKTVRIYRMSQPDPALEESYDYDMEDTYVEVLDSKGENINIPEQQEEESTGFWASIFRRRQRQVNQ